MAIHAWGALHPSNPPEATAISIGKIDAKVFAINTFFERPNANL